MSYTKGPWRIGETGPLLFGHVLLGYQIWSPEARIAFTERQNVGSAKDEANAHLIAAAPELLAALKEALDTIKVFHGPVAWEIYENNAPEMKRFRAAISKAEGKP